MTMLQKQREIDTRSVIPEIVARIREAVRAKTRKASQKARIRAAHLASHATSFSSALQERSIQSFLTKSAHLGRSVSSNMTFASI